MRRFFVFKTKKCPLPSQRAFLLLGDRMGANHRFFFGGEK
ncbi:hypothetical protein HMPREF0530_0227 [Lacticaseibacillus paracasei subsp. paracasei ATCC 25302 = DSM 5622 = JCM 8130]|nr:hypothetical protein HMPREF0530_0227 [Lacticaseibacillus paracasei subsp. paracasei ATCC 25302 = DSM 5622 = JCM 8130]